MRDSVLSLESEKRRHPNLMPSQNLLKTVCQTLLTALDNFDGLLHLQPI